VHICNKTIESERIDGRMDGNEKNCDGTVTEAGQDGHGSRTGWSRKSDGMVTEAGRDGHGEWSKTKDLL
jgi:hypothetical protein